MNSDLSLDEMILQYSENPFVDDELFKLPALSDQENKKGVLNKLLLIAFDLISPKDPESEPSSYKRRYSHNK